MVDASVMGDSPTACIETAARVEPMEHQQLVPGVVFAAVIAAEDKALWVNKLLADHLVEQLEQGRQSDWQCLLFVIARNDD